VAGYYRCPRCGEQSPIRIWNGRLCGKCETIRAWEEAWRSGEPVKITYDDLKHIRPGADAYGPPRSVWILPLAAPVILSSFSGFMLWLFFEPRRVPAIISGGWPPGSPPFIERLNLLLSCASAMGALALIASLIGIWFVWDRGSGRQWRAQLAGVAGFVVAGSVCLTSVICRVGTIPAPAPGNLVIMANPAPLDHRLASSAVTYYREKGGDDRRPAVGSGVVIHKGGGRIWVISAAPSAADLQNTIYVTFANSPWYAGAIRWQGSETDSLLLIEVAIEPPKGGKAAAESTPLAAEVNPWSEAIIPGEDVWMARNLSVENGGLGRGHVIGRRSVSTSIGDYTILFTDLEAAPSDVGGGLYDGDGKLVGLLLRASGHTRPALLAPQPVMRPITREDKIREKARAMALSHDVIRRIIRAAGGRNFDQPQSTPIAAPGR
jgi:hypothetical protein